MSSSFQNSEKEKVSNHHENIGDGARRKHQHFWKHPIPKYKGKPMFSEYWIGCSSVDKTITSIGANILQTTYGMYRPSMVHVLSVSAGFPMFSSTGSSRSKNGRIFCCSL